MITLMMLGRLYIHYMGLEKHSLFVKAKPDLDVLPPTHGTLELHITRANYQAKICFKQTTL